MIEVSGFKRGLCFVFRGQPVQIVDFSLSTPTGRGSQTIAKTRLRNLVTGQLLTESIRAGDKFEPVEVARSPVSFLYSDGESVHFMDGESFEQFSVPLSDLGDQAGYLQEGLEGIVCLRVAERIAAIELPPTVDLEVVQTDPVIKGATAKAQYKRAVAHTGVEVQVPAYVEAGQVVRIDTRDGHFVERVNR